MSLDKDPVPGKQKSDPIVRTAIVIILAGVVAVGGFTAFDYWTETGMFRKAPAPSEPKKG